MKLKYEFETVEMDGKIMAVPVGGNSSELHAMLSLNDTASFILSALKEETAKEEVLEKVLKNYDGDKDEISKYVFSFIDTLKENSLLD